MLRDSEILYYHPGAGGSFLPCLRLFEVEAMVNIIQGIKTPPATGRYIIFLIISTSISEIKLPF